MKTKLSFSFLVFFLILCISSVLYVQGRGDLFRNQTTDNGHFPEVCEYVVSHVNRGQLDKILIPSEPWDSPDIKIPDALSSYGVEFRKLMDINNDGALERVFVTSEGTMHWEDFVFYELTADRTMDIKTSSGDNWESENLRWALDKAVVRFKGVSYLMGRTNQSLHYLAYINPNNEMKVVCEFGQREQPLQSLKTSQDDKVCKYALEGSLEYVEFDKLHDISDEKVHATNPKVGFPHEISPGEKAALIDINNDGKKEVIIPINLSSGAGPGCVSRYIGVLTKDNDAIDNKITDELPGGRCNWTEIVPFLVDGKTYLDERQSGPSYPKLADHRQVYMLEKDQLKTICEFEVRPNNYVLSSV